MFNGRSGEDGCDTTATAAKAQADADKRVAEVWAERAARAAREKRVANGEPEPGDAGTTAADVAADDADDAAADAGQPRRHKLPLELPKTMRMGDTFKKIFACGVPVTITIETNLGNAQGIFAPPTNALGGPPAD